MPSIHVIKPGLLTTVQDEGRWGYQSRGVPPAGPMDWFSFRLANLLVGNASRAACLEVTLIGPELVFDSDFFCAVTGAEFEVTLDGAAVPLDRPFQVQADSRLRFGRRRAGARAYLAVGGGIGGPVVLGSRATHLPSRMGGFAGRAIAEGDRIEVVPDSSARVNLARPAQTVSLPRGGARLRVLTGPHDEAFADEDRAILFTSRYEVSAQSNRMGYRLKGPTVPQKTSGDMISDATPYGGIQIPPSGQPILLMADRATTGGYPLIGTVITADLPIAGQLLPGDWIALIACSRADAMAALIGLERLLL